MDDERGACWRCKYFDRDVDSKDEGGFCRRYPPTGISDGWICWVGVEYIDWCGEFEEAQMDKRDDRAGKTDEDGWYLHTEEDASAKPLYQEMPAKTQRAIINGNEITFIHVTSERQDSSRTYLPAEALDDLSDENQKLRELLAGAYKDMDVCQRIIASSNQWGYGKGYLEKLWELRDAMKELGMEVGLDEYE